MRLPSNNPISLMFGATTPPYSQASPHEGVDFIPANNSTVYAPCDGVAVLHPNNGADGNGLYFYDPQGNFHGLLHNSQYLVTNGAHFKEGDPVAIMGWTGFVDPPNVKGTHSHWCVKNKTGHFINPLSLLEGGKGGSSSMSADALTKDEITQFYMAATLGQIPPADHLNYWQGHGAGEYGRFLLSDPSIAGLKNYYLQKEATREEVMVLHQLTFDGDPAPQSTIDYWTGKPIDDMLQAFEKAKAEQSKK